MFIHHLSTLLRCCFFFLLLYSVRRLREYIPCFMRQTFVLKNESTAEKRREKEAFAILVSIAHCCFMETKHNCVENQAALLDIWSTGWRTEWLENYVKTVGELGMVTRQEWLGKLGWNGKRTMNGWVTRPEQLE